MLLPNFPPKTTPHQAGVPVIIRQTVLLIGSEDPAGLNLEGHFPGLAAVIVTVMQLSGYQGFQKTDNSCCLSGPFSLYRLRSIACWLGRFVEALAASSQIQRFLEARPDTTTGPPFTLSRRIYCRANRGES
jgi:hypothetical protein